MNRIFQNFCQFKKFYILLLLYLDLGKKMFKKIVLNGFTGLIFSLGLNSDTISQEQYNFGIKLDKNTEITLEEKLEEYNIEFDIYKPNFKKNLENKYKINIKGDYTFSDFQLIEEIFEDYGEKWIKNLKISEIVVLPKEYLLYDLEKAKASGKTDKHDYLVGIAYRNNFRIIVKSKKDPFILFHELSHIHYNTIEKKNPEFNLKWEQINGGYINKDQFKNLREDVAELAEAILMIGYEYNEYDLFRILYKLPVFDGNFKALEKKITLLYENDFFPNQFHYGNLANNRK